MIAILILKVIELLLIIIDISSINTMYGFQKNFIFREISANFYWAELKGNTCIL